MGNQPVEAVRRALLLLSELNRKKTSSVGDLHTATGLPKATIVRLLQTLCHEQYATNDRRQGGYQVTANVKALSCGYHGDPAVVEAARPWSIEFTRTHHWPIAIATFERDAVVVRFSTIIDSPVSPFHGTINLRLDLLNRALGRAYLAFCTRERRAFLLDLLEVRDEEERASVEAMLA
ncbi:MAG: helix-turn-helix domain-containing protein, partial [Phyllobacterium sp.]